MEVKTIPKEVLCLIPKYDGEENLLNLFLDKCDYVLSAGRVQGNLQQELYLFHAISSRLTGKAAVLLSDNPGLKSYDQLKELLTQHFGDPRSEECIAIELENLKIKNNESYIQFCHKIQTVKSSLLAKVNRLTDEGTKAAKMIIYNNIALNVFLYNLPEDMIRVVRLKGCTSLESALSIVTEEVNFKFQYDSKNRLLKQTSQPSHSHTQNLYKPLHTSQNFRPAFNPMSNNNFRFSIPQSNNFRFGIPHNNNFKFSTPQNNLGFRPQGYHLGQGMQHAPVQYNQKFTNPQQQNFRFGIQPQQNYKFGITPQQNYKFGIPNQFHPNQNKFGVPNQHSSRLQDNDVSMRTAPIRQNMTELFYMEQPSPCNYDNPDTLTDAYNYGHEYYDTNDMNDYHTYPDEPQTENVNPEIEQSENFQEIASTSITK